MSFSLATLKDELTRDEGRKRRAYKDSEGIWTVGIGWNLEANDLPDDVIDRLFATSVDGAQRALNALEPRWRELDDDRQLVLLNMAFNLGYHRFSKFVRFWEAVRGYLLSRDPMHLKDAADEMLDSLWARQVKARANRLADRMLNSPR